MHCLKIQIASLPWNILKDTSLDSLSKCLYGNTLKKKLILVEYTRQVFNDNHKYSIK